MDTTNIILITLGILQLIIAIVIPIFNKSNIAADRGGAIVTGDNYGNISTNNIVVNNKTKKAQFSITKILIIIALIEFLIAILRYLYV